MSENLIIFDARVVTPTGFAARKGTEMGELLVMDHATIEVTDGVITYVGPNRGENRDGYYQHYWHYNARGRCVLPGFVDSHTHFVFGGERADEFSWRLKGESYMSIMERGGGIVSTVKATRASNFIRLRAKAEGFLKQMNAMGVTTVEGKSGYGLDKETELMQLRIMRSLNGDEHRRVDIVPTFLGAHAVPQEYAGRTDDYIDFLIREVMPCVAEAGLAEFCDVFCEQGVFSIEQSRRLLLAARGMGFDLKLHADEIVPLGGAGLTVCHLGRPPAACFRCRHPCHGRERSRSYAASPDCFCTEGALRSRPCHDRCWLCRSPGHRPEPRQLLLGFHSADVCPGLHLYADEHRGGHHSPHPERCRCAEPCRFDRQHRSR